MRVQLSLMALGVAAVLFPAIGNGGSAAKATSNLIALENSSFAIKLELATASVRQGSSVEVRVLLERKNKFEGEVRLTLEKPPAGVRFRAVTIPKESEAKLPIVLGQNAKVGTLKLLVQASSGELNATADLNLDVQAFVPSSQREIQAALEAGKINYGTSLEYRAYALLNQAKLPTEYLGTGSAPEDNGLFLEIAQNRSKLSAETLEKLEPYLVRPNDPKSIYTVLAGVKASGKPGGTPEDNKLLAAKAGGKSKTKAVAQTGEECAATGNAWISKMSNHPVRVWAYCLGDAAARTAARAGMLKTLEIVNKMYAPMTALMGQPMPDGQEEGALDIYLTPAETTPPRENRNLGVIQELGGVTFPIYSTQSGTAASSFVAIKTLGLQERFFEIIVIHEFFHVLSNAHNVFAIDSWFSEATAEWAASYFSRTIPISSSSLRDFHERNFLGFQQSDASLTDTTSSHDYWAYIYAFFMEQEAGPQIIVNTWKALEGAQGEIAFNDAINDVFSFKEHFRDFAIRNLNTEYKPGDSLPIAKRYVGIDPNFPDSNDQYEPTFESPVTLNTPSDISLSVSDIQPLQAKYINFDVTGTQIKQVKFNFSQVPADGIDLNAVVKINGKYEAAPRDLNGAGEVRFCLDRPTEKLENLILVVSNYGREASAKKDVELSVQVKNEPCTRKARTIHTETSDNPEFFSENRVECDLEQNITRDRLGVYFYLKEARISHIFIRKKAKYSAIYEPNSISISDLNQSVLTVSKTIDKRLIYVGGFIKGGEYTVTANWDNGQTVKSGPQLSACILGLGSLNPNGPVTEIDFQGNSIKSYNRIEFYD